MIKIPNTVRRVHIEGCILWHGDARDIYPGIPADMVWTDPPYKLTSGGRKGEMKGKFSPDAYNNNGSFVEGNITWPEIWKVIGYFIGTTDQAHIYCMANNKQAMHCQFAGEEAGYKNHNLLVWRKNTCTPNRWYMKNLEFILFHKKGKAFPVNDCGFKQDFDADTLRNSPHNTQKPVELMAHHIRQSSKPEDRVADPFMGSGSTMVAAVLEGRKGIGAEINFDFFKLACDRVYQAYLNIGCNNPKVVII